MRAGDDRMQVQRDTAERERDLSREETSAVFHELTIRTRERDALRKALVAFFGQVPITIIGTSRRAKIGGAGYHVAVDDLRTELRIAGAEIEGAK